MQISVEESGPCRKVVRVEYVPEEVTAEYDDVLKEYARSVKLPGFRPGRAPGNLVASKYRKQIGKHLKDSLLQKGYRKAISEHNIDVVAILDVEGGEPERDAAAVFTVTLDVPPDFELPEYKGLPIEGRKIEVTEDDVEQALEHIRERMASHETVEGRPVQMGDFVQVDYEAVSENKPLAEMLEEDNGLAKGEATWLPVKENVLAPGFHKGLVGKEIGEKCEIQVDFDEHFSEQGLEGKKAVYFVEIKAIRGQKKPELDDAFAKEAGAESMESLRDALKTEIQQYKQNEEHNRHADVIVDKLLSSVNFDLPESVVNEETRHSIYNIVQSNTRRGVSSEEIQEKKDEIYAAATRSAKDKVKLRYILHRIADEENIKVTSAEVQGYLRMMAMRYGMDPETLTQKMEEENRLNEIEESIRQKKTLDFLIEEAQVSV